MIDLMNAHVEECTDDQCICDEIETFYDLLKFRMLHSHSMASIQGYECEQFTKIVEDHGLIGTISAITDTTSGVNGSSESNWFKDMNGGGANNIAGLNDTDRDS